MFGSFDSEEERKRQRGRRNRLRGQIAEEQARVDYELSGWETVDNHEGYDFTARRRDPITGEVLEERKVEVKSGSSDLTKRQREEKRRSDNYEVYRSDPPFLF